MRAGHRHLLLFTLIAGPAFAVTAAERFEQLDSDGDGVLTAAELPYPGIFRAMDADGDGHATRAEAAAWAARQRRERQVVDDLDAPVPEPSADTLFATSYRHLGRAAQATALIDVLGDDGLPELLIASKGQVHLVRNLGEGRFAHAETLAVDGANGWGSHDIDGDGRLDAFIARGGADGETSDWLLTTGEGSLSPASLGNESVGLARNVVFADFDGDGAVDSFHSVSAFADNHAGCQLHPGTGDGRFGPDRIREMLAPARPDFWYAPSDGPDGPGAAWANKMFKGAVVRDFDGDGRPDLVACSYADRGYQDPRDLAYAIAWVESQDRGVFVFHNRSEPGSIRFAEVAREAIGPRAHGNTVGDWNAYCAIPIDYDRDGDWDLFVGGYIRLSADGGREDTRLVGLFENVSEPGRIAFVDRTEEAGFAHFNQLPPAQRALRNFASGVPVDYDNDGWVDLCIINRKAADTPYAYPHLFRNTGEGRFEEVSPERHGLSGGGGRDVIAGDIDGDGRLDLVVNDGEVGGHAGSDETRVYRNQQAGDHHWLQLDLRDGDGRIAFGSRIELRSALDDRLLGLEELRTDVAYRSKRDHRLHFGLGDEREVVVLVRDAGGREWRFEAVAADGLRRLELRDEPARQAPTTESATARVTITRDLPYHRVPGVEPDLLSLDVSAPVDSEGAPVLVYVHGGGWHRGDKARVHHLADTFTAAGYVFVSINYRLVPAAEFPAPAQDVAAALAWVHAHAGEYGGDARRIAVMGHSAGGHLVGLVACDPRYLAAHDLDLAVIRAAVINDAAAFDLVEFAAHNGGQLPSIYGQAFGQDPADWQRYSPQGQLAAEHRPPPMAVIFSGGGRADRENPRRALLAQAFAAELRAVGGEATVIDASALTHAQVNQDFGGEDGGLAAEVLAFLAERLALEP